MWMNLQTRDTHLATPRCPSTLIQNSLYVMCVGDSNISDVTLIWQLSFSGPPLEMSDDKMEHSKNGIFRFYLNLNLHKPTKSTKYFL